MRRIIHAIGLACAAAALVACEGADAQGRTVQATWVNATQYVDGTPMPASALARTCVTVSSTPSGAAIQPETCASGAATSVQVTLPSSFRCGTLYFTATHETTAGQRSSPSNEVARTWACAPNPPTGLTVT